jgi:hypothetical protein
MIIQWFRRLLAHRIEEAQPEPAIKWAPGIRFGRRRPNRRARVGMRKRMSHFPPVYHIPAHTIRPEELRFR